MRRSSLVVLLVCSLLVNSAPVGAALCWEPPVMALVADPFREPACPWCPGNRGIAYATPVGMAVRAVAAGRVTFAGVVAGTRYLVVELANGWRLTYGNLADPRAGAELPAGAPVVAGMVVGHTAGDLHFGLRDDAGVYRDPAPNLGTWHHRARLIPLDEPPPPAPPPVLRCSRA